MAPGKPGRGSADRSKEGPAARSQERPAERPAERTPERAAQPPTETAAKPATGFGAWLDRRTGYRALLGHLLDEPVPGGPSFGYVFGSLLLFLLVNQGLTGVLLAASYAPSAKDAWAAVAFLQDQVQLGWFLRGMHSAGASAMVVGMLLHLLQTALYGAYRAPRELNWWSGLLLFGVVLAFALTGYLLPWDQKGYWATQVATTLLGTVPLVGAALQEVLQGGPRYGNLTLTHFYTLHVLVLPLILILLVTAHVALFRRHGVTPSWRRRPSELEAATAPFFPGQAARDLLAAAALCAILVAQVLRTHGAELGAPADPSAPYDARPEWYFLPLFQLLKLFPGALEGVVALGAPLLLFGALASLPLIDKAESTAPQKRIVPLGLVAVSLGAVALLGLWARVQDRANPLHHKNVQAAHKQALYARQLALLGVPAAGGVAVYDNDPLNQGRRLFDEHCTSCHRGSPSLKAPPPGDEKGPDLTRLWSRAWLTEFLKDPDSPRFYGRTKLKGSMKAVRLPPEALADLVEYLVSLGGTAGGLDAARVQRGAALFESENCDLCHERDGKAGQGPGLKGYGSLAFARAILHDPGAPELYGSKNDMPAFGKKLSPTEIDRLAAFLVTLRAGQ
jgi:ubiquinol-cytochrome c reductase cytochrome b subunit